MSDARSHQEPHSAAPSSVAGGGVHPLLLEKAPKVRSKPKHNRKALIALVVVGSAICLGMGYWQLSRWSSSQGTFMNLGYAFEWPFFAAFLVFVYRRFVRLEDERENEAKSGRSIHDKYVTSAESGRRADGVQTEIPANFLPQRERPRAEFIEDDKVDPGLAEYNSYLSTLDTPSGTTQNSPG